MATLHNDLVKFCKAYPNIKDCSIQTFNDRDKEERSQSRILEMTTDNLNKCVLLQNKLPYWIFFSVNPMEKGKRNKESVTHIQTWICDIDTWDKEQQIQLITNTLQPSLVVESNHWFHLYYLANRDLSLEEFESINRWLKNYFNWDAKVVKDTARVLRLPWFYHCKGEKYLVKFREDLSSLKKYTIEEMNKAFPNQSDTTPWRVKQREQYNKQLDETDSFWSKAGQLNTKAMLEELSWTNRMNGDYVTFKRNSDWTEQIYCNSKSTGCWIDNNGLIGSADKGWPTWIQWLKWYGVIDRPRLAEYLKEKHPELEPPKKKKEVAVNLISNFDKVKELRIPDFTWWDDMLDSKMWKFSKGQFIILCWETWAWKTTYATFMARKNKWSCYIVLEDKVENIASRYAMKRAGITVEEMNTWTWWEEKSRKYVEAFKNFNRWGINYIDVWEKIWIDQLMEIIKEQKANGHELFFIDNLGFIAWEWENEERQTAMISNVLNSFCTQENVCIVLLHHFKKKQQAFGMRDIWQMRWSWKLWDDANKVVEYARDEEWTMLNVYKDREWWNLWSYNLIYDRWDFIYKPDSNDTSVL